MPRRKKSRLTGKNKSSEITSYDYNDEMSEGEVNPVEKPSQSFLSRKTIILIIILIIALAVWKFKGLFIAATVNGQPISRWYVNDELNKRFGSQILDSIINERLILAAAREKGIFVTGSEIDARMKEIEKQLDGKMSISDALKAQGMTQDDFRRQLEIQISIDKLFSKEATVSSQEIDDYKKKNEEYYKDATDSAKVKEEIEGIIQQQKIKDLFDKWFTEVKSKAVVNKYI